MSGLEVFGASVRGPAHVAERAANQDAWTFASIGRGRIAVVCDGAGSKAHAREGSRAACRAVIRAARAWRRTPEASLDVMLSLVHVLWRAEFAPRVASECACTCLFALVEPDGSGWAGQLGDGAVLVEDADGMIAPLTTRDPDGFSNLTAALGDTPARLSAWTARALGAGTRSVTLCTDGVADDLRPEALADFNAWLRLAHLPLAPNQRWRALSAALRDWPTPHHLDDKTIAMIVRQGADDEPQR